MKFVVYDSDGKILRGGHCQASTFDHQAQDGEFVMERSANDVRQKIVAGKIIDKTPTEIEQDNPSRVPLSFGNRPVKITNGQLQSILQRLDAIEAK